jgi:hypothetical protein
LIQSIKQSNGNQNQGIEDTKRKLIRNLKTNPTCTTQSGGLIVRRLKVEESNAILRRRHIIHRRPNVINATLLHKLRQYPRYTTA